MRVTRLIVLPLTVLAASTGMAMDIQHSYCAQSSSASRQTIVIADEDVARADASSTGTWSARALRTVIDLLHPGKASRTKVLAPHEHVTLAVVPHDGSQINLVFDGCEPIVYDSELRSAEEKARDLKGWARWMFGGSPRQVLEKDQGEFLGALSTALAAYRKTTPRRASPSQTVSFKTSWFWESLVGSSGLVNLEYGIPRIVFVVNLARVTWPTFSNTVQARKAGFALGEDIGGRFSRSVLYLIVPRTAVDPIKREFLYACFLPLEGWLRSVSSGGWVGGVRDAPTKVEVYAGTAAYGQVDLPIRIRLSWDADGKLVNSWMRVWRALPVSIPLNGMIQCKGEHSCKVTADDSGFAQLWSPDPDAEPEFTADLPFSGLRYFKFEIEREKLTGRVFDPKVGRIGSSQRRYLALKALRSVGGRF